MDSFETWQEIDEAVFGDSGFGRRAEHPRPTVVFRGLARADFSNATSLMRLRGDCATLERHLLRNFRKYAHRESPGDTCWDWLALGQHHGLPTRMLDWTFSPLVALHFATATWRDEDAVLWAVDVAAVHETLPPVLAGALADEGALVFTTGDLARHAPTPEDLDGLADPGDPFAVFLEPPSLDERIVNQAAVLSMLADPGGSWEDFFARHAGTARAWRIPAELKREVRRRLDQAHVTERSLMPGLDGLAAWLRRYYSPEWLPDDGPSGASMDGSDRGAQQEGSMG